MPTKLVVDCSTGIQTEVELTAEEIAQMKKDAEEYAKAKAEQDAINEAKTQAKESAITKLTALGLSEEEIKALIG